MCVFVVVRFLASTSLAFFGCVLALFLRCVWVGRLVGIWGLEIWAGRLGLGDWDGLDWLGGMRDDLRWA